VPDGFESRLDYLNSLNASWYYNWTMTPHEGDTALEFIPMQWGTSGIEEVGAKAAQNAEAGVILGFNEPDHYKQAGMSVEEAIALWPELEATGLRLGSPAPAQWDRNDESWLARFMEEAQANDLRVDFIALHTYTGNRNVENLKSYLIDVFEKYQKPIWITEFALVDWSDAGRFSEEQSAAFLHDTFMMLDDLEFVEKYAWYRPSEADERDAHRTWHFYRDGEETAVYDAYAELMF